MVIVLFCLLGVRGSLLICTSTFLQSESVASFLVVEQLLLSTQLSREQTLALLH